VALVFRRELPAQPASGRRLRNPEFIVVAEAQGQVCASSGVLGFEDYFDALYQNRIACLLGGLFAPANGLGNLAGLVH